MNRDKSTLVAVLFLTAGLFVMPVCGQTAEDTTHYQMKNTGFGITDIDHDGLKEIIMFDDNSGLVRVYVNIGTDSYGFVKEWKPNPTGWVSGATVKSRIPALDLDKDGVYELYLADTKGNTWVITPNGDVSTMFDDANWHLLHDWKVGLTQDVDYNEGGEIRGSLPGDVDRDNKPDIYFAGNNFAAILDMEYDGGDVTDGDNYSYYITSIDGDEVSDTRFARPSYIALSDMDNDGHLEVAAIVPWTGDNPVDNLKGLYVFEHEKTTAAPSGSNTALSKAWHEASDTEFVRGYVFSAGIDIDQDGKGEILTYDGDGGQRIVYLFESDGDNSYKEVWKYQFSDGTLGIVGGERGIMVADLDNDGFAEITVITDSEHPDSTDGFKAGHVFEWDGKDIDGTAGQGLPSTPSLTFDPPRDALSQVRLEYNTQVVQLDDDANPEIVMTHRGGHGTFLSIMELENSDFSSPTWNVEFEETFAASDTIHYQMKNTGFGITDIDKDSHKEIIMFDDNTGLVRVYENTGTDAYSLVKEWQPSPTNWVSGATVKSRIPALDLDKDGVYELYLADTKGNTWVITPNGDVSTMFDDANWHLLHDWKVGLTQDVDYNEGGEIRGSLPGDVDRDNKPDIYFAGNNFAAILDMEYDGGDVTDGDNYSYYITSIDGDEVSDTRFARPSNIALSDMDNDGHLEVVAIVPWTGDNPVDNLKGLYVFEHDLTAAAPTGSNSALSLAWHEASDTEFVRGYVFSAGIDIDQDGKGEILTYDGDGGQRIVYLFESDGDNSYKEVWKYQFSDGTLGIVGGERGIMVADLDNDGFVEVTVIMDSEVSGTVNGFDAGHIFEWDGTDDGLPSTPTLTFDPPRDDLHQVRLEYNTTILQMDDDANPEIVMTHRGGHGLFLSIMELENSDFSSPNWNVEFKELFILGIVGIELSDQMPTRYSLKQNYPNPFNPVTKILYEIPEEATVSLGVYNLLGRSVRNLVVHERQAPGIYVALWDGRDNAGTLVPSGVYIYRLETEQFVSTKKMVLLK